MSVLLCITGGEIIDEYDCEYDLTHNLVLLQGTQEDAERIETAYISREPEDSFRDIMMASGLMWKILDDWSYIPECEDGFYPITL